MLYPYENPIRGTCSLNGIWDFCLGSDEDITNQTYLRALEGTQPMPVPSSYNDIGCDPSHKNHIGIVWYERRFYRPQHGLDKKYFLRFGSVTHRCKVYLNGSPVGEHDGGYMPFEFDITLLLQESNRLTVAVDNRLTFESIPIGEVLMDRQKPRQEYYFDFFNYSGIHRNVHLYSVHKEYIEQLHVQDVLDVDLRSVKIKFLVKVNGMKDCQKLLLRVLEASDNCILSTAIENRGDVSLENVVLWQVHSGYRYTLEFSLWEGERRVDCYRLPYGFRKIAVKDAQIQLNDEPVYLRGFGKHEDSSINGRGYNEVVNVKDFNIMKWSGANSLRTAHYPYSEEFLELADREGFLVISETAAVGLDLRIIFAQMVDSEGTKRNTWSAARCQKQHEQAVRQLILRDRHRPSVIMFSLANEPASQEEGAAEYFQPLMALARVLDPSRPMTIVQHIDSDAHTSRINDLVDVLAINRYWGWYNKPALLDAIEVEFAKELQTYHEKYPSKPVLLAEYGADCISGHHSFGGEMWTEDFQIAILERYHKVLDAHDFCVGEHVWNFADFMTKEGIIRVGGNKKGVCSRDRQPKRAIFYLKERWLAQSLDGSKKRRVM